MQNSLMLLTSLRTVIGWDKSSKIVREAMNNRTAPNKAAGEKTIDQIVDPRKAACLGN